MEIALPVPGYLEKFEKRVLGTLAAEAEEWAGCLNALSRWEDEHLIDDQTPERIAEHKQIVEAMMRLGAILQWTTKHADYPDRPTAEMVEATMQGLQDVYDAWHVRPRMSKAESDRILAEVFPHESRA